MSTEIELKYLTDEAGLTALATHPLVVAACPAGARTQRLVSTYYDTPDLTLKAHKLALRLRETGSGYVQTIKGEAVSHDGLSRRTELEWDTAGPHLEHDKLRACAFDDVLAQAGYDRLAPVFTTDFTRELRDLVFADGTRAEMALDRGAVVVGDSRTPITELELEFKGGNTDTMVAFGLALKNDLNLVPGDESKAKRGYALYAQTRT